MFPFLAFNIALTRKKQGLDWSEKKIEQILEISALRERLSSRLLNPLISIKNATEILNASKKITGGYRALNNDPGLMIYLDSALQEGFYLLEIQIVLNSGEPQYVSRIYKDYGPGYNEQHTLVIAGKSHQNMICIVKFEKPVKSLRFDPVDEQVDFDIKAFNLASVTPSLATKSMKLALMEKNKNVPECGDGDFSALYNAYSEMLQNGLDSVTYDAWVEHVEMPALPGEQEVRRKIEGFKRKPIFSIVTPVYNTNPRLLRLCIDSVVNQSYPYWELCVADDCSPQTCILEILDEYVARDSRIKVVKRAENGHISVASNSALSVAKGDFIALLDHDDELARHALFFMAEAINQFPQAKIIYSDEDKIDTKGKRSDPHFKSAWNPDLFYSQNYVCHLAVYDAEIISAIGGFRTGVEGAQDQDLLLRCLPYVKSHEILHIPRVLYHWRMIEGSTAMASSEKGYTTDAGIKALRDYFRENGLEQIGVEAGMLANTYKLQWPMPCPPPKVNLLVPTRDRREITEVAVRSILEKTTYSNYQIMILDNGSMERETLDFFQRIQEESKRVVVLRYDHPFNFSAINNFGVEHADGELIGLVNNDIEVISPDWLSAMVRHATRKEIGCVGAKLYYSNDTLQHGGVILGLGGIADHSHKYVDRCTHGYFGRLEVTQNVSAVTGACLLVRKEVYEQVGGLDEVNLKVAFNDVDFCLKVREAGYRNLWTPDAELYHHESISRGPEDTPEKQARFSREVQFMKMKWGNVLENDPYYHPNLSRKTIGGFGYMGYPAVTATPRSS